jgi:HD-like signal output (HDOD) protein
VANLFERLGRPPPLTEKAIEQLGASPTEKLLDWLVKHWSKPTVTARAICKFGPNSIRNDTKTILNLAQNLADQGWLIPVQTWRHDKREWKIVRGLPLGK